MAEQAKAAEDAKAAALAAKQAEQAKAAAACRRAGRARRWRMREQAAQARQAAEAKPRRTPKPLPRPKQAAEAKAAADAKAAKAAAEAKAAADELRKATRRGGACLRRRGRVRCGIAMWRAFAIRIQNAWIKPPSARVGVDCLVEVTQVPGGEVTSAKVTQCNGDAAVRQSIENAVYRASPLPDPPDPALFQRNFAFRFKPDE